MSGMKKKEKVNRWEIATYTPQASLQTLLPIVSMLSNSQDPERQRPHPPWRLVHGRSRQVNAPSKTEGTIPDS